MAKDKIKINGDIINNRSIANNRLIIEQILIDNNFIQKMIFNQLNILLNGSTRCHL